MREGILDFVFDLLRHAEESAYLYELSVLLQAMAADTFDELFVISVLLDSITHSQVCNRLQTLVVNHPDTIKAVSFPQYILYISSLHEIVLLHSIGPPSMRWSNSSMLCSTPLRSPSTIFSLLISNSMDQ